MTDSLPDRMREAAKVLREADRRCHGRIEGWTPLDLEGTAEAWEAEDNAAAEREAMVEELAREVYAVIWGASGATWERNASKEIMRAHARRLIAAGWRKGGSDEMSDLTARITEILHSTDLLREIIRNPEPLATKILAAAEEHYRPRVETVEQLDALPFLTVIREVFRPSPGSGTDYGGIYERRTSGWQCLAGAWVEPQRNGDPKLPVVVLWPPGAGE